MEDYVHSFLVWAVNGEGQLRALTALHHGKSLLYPSNKRLGGYKSRPGRFGGRQEKSNVATTTDGAVLAVFIYVPFFI
jgi:hypothetical protein